MSSKYTTSTVTISVRNTMAGKTVSTNEFHQTGLEWISTKHGCLLVGITGTPGNLQDVEIIATAIPEEEGETWLGSLLKAPKTLVSVCRVHDKLCYEILAREPYLRHCDDELVETRSFKDKIAVRNGVLSEMVPTNIACRYGDDLPALYTQPKVSVTAVEAAWDLL